VAGAGDGMMVPAPVRPGEDETGGVGIVGALAGHEAAQLGDGDGAKILKIALQRTRPMELAVTRLIVLDLCR